MIPFLTFREPNNEGELMYCILQRNYPHYIFSVSTHPKEKIVAPIQITGYYMWICFEGVLVGEVIPAYKSVFEEIHQVMNNASNWYYENRIVVNEKKYKKFKK